MLSHRALNSTSRAPPVQVFRCQRCADLAFVTPRPHDRTVTRGLNRGTWGYGVWSLSQRREPNPYRCAYIPTSARKNQRVRRTRCNLICERHARRTGQLRAAVPKRRRIWRKLMVGGLLAGSVSLFAVAAPPTRSTTPGCRPTSARGQLGRGGRPAGPGEPGHQPAHAASVAVCVRQQPWSVDWSIGTGEFERHRDLR